MNIHINEFCLEEGQQSQILVPISIQVEKSSEVSGFLFIRVWAAQTKHSSRNNSTGLGWLLQHLWDRIVSAKGNITPVYNPRAGAGNLGMTWCVFVKSVLQYRMKWHQRDLEWFGLEGTLKGHLVQPLPWAGTSRLLQVSPNPIQIVLEHF